MTTGLDLSRLFDDKIDSSFSDYVSVPKKQRAFDNAFIRILENKYRGLDTQKEYDELSELFVIDHTIPQVNNNRVRTSPVPVATVSIGANAVFTFRSEHNIIVGDTFTVSAVTGNTITNINQTHTATAVSGLTVTTSTNTTGTVSVDTNTGQAISPKMVWDYLHILTMKTSMYSPSKLDRIPIYAVLPGNPGRIEFYKNTPFRTGDVAFGMIDPTGSAGFILLKRVNEFVYEIFDPSDTTFSTPNLVNFKTDKNGGAFATPVITEIAKYLPSDRRISRAGKPTINNPRYNQDERFLKMFPTEAVCRQVKIDYIKKPEVSIIVDNSTEDLELFYNSSFLNRVVDEAVKMFYRETRGTEQFRMTEREMVDNP